MRRLIIAICLLFAVGLMNSCNKDQDKVAQLEKEVQEAETEDSILEGGTGEESEVAGEATASEQYSTGTSYEEESISSYEPTTTGGYTVQIAAGTSLVDAKYLAEKFISRGYDIFINETVIDDVTCYRIRVGNYSTYEEAKTVGLELKDKYSVNDFWVDNNI